MADNSIDLVVSQKAFTQLKDLLDEIKKADDAITALNVNAGKNPTTPSGGEANAAENAKIIAQMKELNAQINRQAEQIKKLEEARRSYSRAITQDTIDTRASNAVLTQNLQLTSKKIGDYQKLDIEYKKAIKTAQDLGAKYGENSKKFLEAANAAKELDNRLKTIDGAVGKYGRNVGNYASGWNGLANSVNQLTREAPAFANSLNTGFMALSNNIPILYDEINNLIIKNKELAASGKPTESVFKSLAASLLSWQTVISVAVTLLTVYGEELVNLAMGINATDKEISKMNKSFADSKNVITEEMISLRVLTDIVNDNTQSQSNRKSAYDDILKIFPSMISKTYEQAIATKELMNVTDAYIKYLVIQEQLKIQIHNAAVVATKQNERESMSTADLLTVYQKTFLGAAKLLGLKKQAIEVVKESIKADDAALKSQAKVYDDSIKSLTNEANALEGLFESKKKKQKSLDNQKKESLALDFSEQKSLAALRVAEYEKEKQLIVDKLNAYKISSAERLALEQELQDKTYDVLLKQFDKEKAIAEEKGKKDIERSELQFRNSKKTEKDEALLASNKKAINERTSNEIAASLANFNAKKETLNSNSAKRIAEFDEKMSEQSVKLRIAELDASITANKLIADNNVKNEEKSTEERQKAFDAYIKLTKDKIEAEKNLALARAVDPEEKELIEAQFAALTKALDNIKSPADIAKQAMKDFARSFIDDFAGNSGFADTLKMFDGKDSLFSRIQKGSAFTKDSWKADTVQMMEAAQEMYNFIANASQQNFDAEYERLDKQKEVALQFAGESASAREKVEEDYEAKKKEIVNRENKAKKKQAIFNIGIDTAQAILSALATIPPPANIPFSIAVGLLGAAQMAVVAAQKIPQYFDGTDNHPGGLALINDGKGANYKETVVTPDGKVRQFNGRDVMIDAPAGTQVFTHDQWNNELNTMMREKGVSMSNSFSSRSGLSYAEMDSIIAKHFSKITTQSTVIDRNGFNTFVSNGSSKTIRNQSRYSGTGFSV